MVCNFRTCKGLACSNRLSRIHFAAITLLVLPSRIVTGRSCRLVCSLNLTQLLPWCARVLQPTSNPFMETLRSVIMRTKWFLFLLLLTVYGFAAAFYTLFRYDQKTSVSCPVAVSSITL